MFEINGRPLRPGESLGDALMKNISEGIGSIVAEHLRGQIPPGVDVDVEVVDKNGNALHDENSTALKRGIELGI